MRTIIFILSLFASTTIIFSQENAEVKQLTVEQRAENSANDLKEKLGLNESQKMAVMKIQLKFFKSLEKLKGNFTKKTPKEQNEAIKKMQKLNNSREKSILKLLNDDQKTIFQNTISTNKAVKKEVLPPKEKTAVENKNIK